MGFPRRTVLAVVLAASAGCSLVLGLEEPRYEDDADSGTGPDAAPSEGGDDDARGSDDAGDASPSGLDPFLDPTRWTSFDGPPAVTAGSRDGWLAGTFDGRYVYFLRTNNPVQISRYDTQREADFADPAAWSTLALGTVSSAFFATVAATFDGRYVLVANQTSDAGSDATIARYDTTSALPFDAASSWELLDAATISAAANRFIGAATYRGRTYLSGNGPSRPFLRHGAGASLDAGWEAFNPTLDAGAACNRSILGAACAGDYVYFAPGGAATSGDCVVRYDVTKAFDAGTSWDGLGIATLGLGSGYTGAVSDGSRVYLTQFSFGYVGAGASIGRVVRHDPGSSLDAGWSQRFFTADAGPEPYWGGTFDGRFVYFAPVPAAGSVAMFLRYDTTRDFGDDGAWTKVPGNKLQLANSSHRSALFDGKYVYFARNAGSTVRYRAREDRVPVASCSAF